MLQAYVLIDHANIYQEISKGLTCGFLRQWLVFRDDGKVTAVDYAKMAADATTEGRAVGEWEFWDRFDKTRPILRRLIYITKLLRGTFEGLAFMHSRGRLHQSLGPASVVVK